VGLSKILPHQRFLDDSVCAGGDKSVLTLALARSRGIQIFHATSRALDMRCIIRLSAENSIG
jgi:hypothetical protein